MSQTYDDTLPTDMDKVRSILWITDVSSEEAALRTDEHIDAVLAWQGSIDGAVRYIASSLAAEFAQKPSSIHLPSGLSVSWFATRVTHWQMLAAHTHPTGAGDNALSFVPATYGGQDAADEFARPPDYWP